MKSPQHITKDALHAQAIARLQSTEGPWALACSGGADSVCLLFTLKNLFPDQIIHILHFNHQTRPEENKNEEIFVKKIAKELQFPLHVLTPETPPEHFSEAYLRTLRLQAFHKKLSELNIKILLQGHHLDDLAESFLMKLSRGSGAEGLSAPRPLQVFKNGIVHVRPFLSINKEIILTTLENAAIPWCDDSSNDQDHYFRNRMRKYVVPEWKAACPTEFYKGLMLSRQQLEEDQEALEYFLYTQISRPLKGKPQNLSALKNKPQALLRRAIKDWLYAQKFEFSLAFLNTLIHNILSNKSSKITLSNHIICLENNILSILEEESPEPIESQELPLGTAINLPNNKSLKAELIAPTSSLLESISSGAIDNTSEAYVDLHPEKPLQVRSWKNGDKYHPFNAPGSQKLQDIFTNAKIPATKRNSLPLVLYENEILWIPQFPINHKLRIKSNSNLILKLTYT